MIKISTQDRIQALSCLEKLKMIDAQSGSVDSLKLLIEPTSESVELPKVASDLLLSILNNIANGNASDLNQHQKVISTQEAAEVLQISRPTVVQLCEEGKLSFFKVGTHRRLLHNDVLEFKRKRQCQREDALQSLAKQAQELRLGYD